MRYMKIVMDSDCLVKLVKAGAKEAVVSSMTVHITPLVKKETVDEGRNNNFPDAELIHENIGSGKLTIVKSPAQRSATVTAIKGEMETAALFKRGGYDAIASDDRRFLRKLEAANIPYLTPAACVAHVYLSGKIERKGALALLEALRPLISREEYAVTKIYLEAKS